MKLVKWLPLLLLLAFYTYLLAKPIDLTVVDLGRHLVNGREIIQGNFQVLYQNTYSYTLPQQPFVNHHWLAGVIFYAVYTLGGFLGLHLFHTAVLLVSFSLFYFLLKKTSDDKLAFAVGSVSLLLLASRSEIRPESFGLLILLIFLHLISIVRQKKLLSPPLIGVLLVLQVLWTNLHISFVFGPFLFWLLWLVTKDKKFKKQLLWLWLGLGLVTLINPNVLRGSLAPLTIFRDYGYRVFENQTLWFLRNYYRGPIIPLYYLTSLVILFNTFWLKLKASAWDKYLALIGILLGFMALRNLPLFVVFSLPLLARQLKQLVGKQRLEVEQPRLFSMLVLGTVFATTLLVAQFHPLFGKQAPRYSGFGLIKGQDTMLAVIKELPQEAVIFNNYDIGSMLVFSLYPDNSVFVDNRPEAFSQEFFQQQYIPMQQSEALWGQSLDIYQFDYLVIGHRDLTEWTQAFLKARLADEEWRVVYQDGFVVIFAPKDMVVPLSL